ncbi:protein translocase subunit SecF [Oscillatoria salina]|uniref:protein translocase subunit SecF n=1 Tax=Oscillatoria salina TaxID=331517 RepID=UPI0013BE62AC|nr:protein translocase subunit SecF [Oscillatoria salina]MBZ8181402.1 protein translocase subunit SecF [Oscillatoria salina IIICB1]NET88708.1 protein translocase subunit SecF [Kamptonema sp. SIO1D9]
MKLNIIKQQRLWWTVSAIAVLISAIAMTISWFTFNAPLRPGLDFVGGTRLQLERDCSVAGNCDEPINSGQVRDILAAQDLANSSIQVIGEDKQTLSIRTKTLNVDERTQLRAALSEEIGTFDPETTQIETVGPTIGQELFTAGILALIVSFFGIIVYLSFRFQFDYALFAIIALFHDAFITAGIFSIFGLVFGVEVDSLFLVAILTIIGFSVNDTVIIYDRIRETIAENPKDSITDIVDNAVNQTLSRSINTTLTTLLPLIAIALFGGETLKFFALTLIIGFILGAYSSIFVGSTLLAWWRVRQGKERVAFADSQPHEET